MALILFGIVLLLGMSAFFSGTETAVMALDRYKIKALAAEGDENAKRLLHYLDTPERFFSVVLLVNTFANIAAASLFTVWVVDIWGEMSVLATMFLTIWVLLFCEYWPKSMAARHVIRFRMDSSVQTLAHRAALEQAAAAQSTASASAGWR